MTQRVFAETYADAYDLLYQEKNYRAECDLLEVLFKRHGAATRRVLDLGCGTGNHALILAERGYEVVGIDRSEEMLDNLRKKAASSPAGERVTFYRGDIRKLNLKGKFDAAIMMFAVLGYQQDNEAVLSTLQAAHRHLHSGGLLVFDVWFGPAVLAQRPSDRVKTIPTRTGRILRVASGELDILRHLCAVHYHIWRLEDDQLVSETEESHLVRFFFPKELEFFLKSSGFSLIRLGAFPDFERDPDEKSWNILAVAKAV